MMAIEKACFKGELAPGKLLRYSSKERESLIAYQKKALEVCGGNVDDILDGRPVTDWSSAPHRWENDESKYCALTLSYLAFVWKASDASQDQRLKPEQREAYTMCMREVGGLEAGCMIGLHADFLAKAHETLELVQPDVQDASEIPFLMDKLTTDLHTLYIMGGIWSKHARNMYSRIVLTTTRRPSFPLWRGWF